MFAALWQNQKERIFEEILYISVEGFYFQVQVQLYDTSSKETVYASVDRTSVNQVVATTASAASLTALIQKIG